MTRQKDEAKPQKLDEPLAAETWTSRLYLVLEDGSTVPCDNGQFTEFTITGRDVTAKHSKPSTHDITGKVTDVLGRRYIKLNGPDAAGRQRHRGILIPGTDGESDRYIGHWRGDVASLCGRIARLDDQGEAIWVATKTG